MRNAFGFTPITDVPVVLTFNADFVTSIVRKDGTNWPDGTVIKFRFDDPSNTVWPATITGPTASWSVDKPDVISLLESKLRDLNAELLYTDGTGLDLVWYLCETKRYGSA